MFVVVFGILQFIVGSSSPLRTKSSPQNIGIQLGHIPKHIDDSACTLAELKVPDHRISPTFLPSYPGSGTKLQWAMVEALTGIPTTDDQFSNGHHNVVGIKTHYPCLAGREFSGAEDIRKAILFVRHPMDSLPAYFNMIHASESEQGYDPEHVPIAPLESWKEWRDHSFTRELDTWRKHLEYWADRYKPMDRLIISYEQFTHQEYGPELTAKIAEFLSRSDGITTVSPEEIPCVWHKIIVKELPADTVETDNPSRKDFNSSVMNLRRRLQMMPPPNQLANGITKENPIYENDMSRKQLNQVQSHSVTSLEHQHSDKIPAHSELSQSIHADQRDQQHEKVQLLQQEEYNDNIIVQHQGKRAVQIMSSPNSIGGDQPESMVSQTKMKPADMQGFASQQNLKNQRISKRERGAKKRPRPQSEGLNNAGDQSKSSSQHAGKKVGADVNPENAADNAQIHGVNEVDAVIRKPGESISELIGRVQKDKEKEEHLTQKEDNSEVMDDVSGRPYTGEQKKEVVIVLAQLLEKYGSDRVLTPLMVSYIDGVERRHKHKPMPSE